MRRDTLGAAVTLVSVLALCAAASAGPAGRWTQITHQNNGAQSNLGLARGKDGTLHVLWAGPTRAPYSAILDTPIAPSGAVGKSHPVVSGWSGVNPPTAAAASDGSIHAIVSGGRVSSNTDPNAGLNDIVGPGSWKLPPQAFGNASLVNASNADVHSAFLKTGQLVSVWVSAAKLFAETGVDPSTQPQDITPPTLASHPQLAVDQASGAAVVAYHGVNDGQNYLREILPSLGAPRAIPQSKSDGVQLAARAGGGVYTAYTPDGTRVFLLRFGGRPVPVPVPKRMRILTAGVAAGPEGRLWVFYGNEQQTYVTRTSKAIRGFEPVQTLRSAKNVAPFRLEGEGSAGPLDLFSDLTPVGAPNDGTYHTHVLPALSLAVAKHGKSLTVRVTDAGDPVAGARVSGFTGGVRTTDASGSITVPPVKKGSRTLTATKPGYVPAKAKAAS